MRAETNEDFEIEIYDDGGEVAQPALVLPANIAVVGTLQPDDVHVYVRQDAFWALEEYSKADVRYERGAILLGSAQWDHGTWQVVVSDYIEARYADASPSTLTFTHETWDYVNECREREHPDKRIVGWHHTHPGYGIFLSNYDLFIHENFYCNEYQIAYVVDPKQDLRGFFQWRNGGIERIAGFCLYDNPEIEIEIPSNPAICQEQRPASLAGIGGMASHRQKDVLLRKRRR